MRKIVYIFIGLIIVSCTKNHAPKNIDIKAVEALEEGNLDYEIPIENNENNDAYKFKFSSNQATNSEYQDLAIQKLKEVSDLIHLQEQHPEFKEDIEAQLNTLIQKDTNLKFLDSTTSIENILQKGNIEKVSDSIQKMTLHFNIVSENKTVTDSLNAFIISKIVIIDGSSVKTNKIRFSKID